MNKYFKQIQKQRIAKENQKSEMRILKENSKSRIQKREFKREN